MALSWRDNTEAYGLITRTLHWSMAALFVWQFSGMALGKLGILKPLAEVIGSTHVSVGTLLLALVMLRGAWGLANFRNRPPAPAEGLGRLAPLGHFALYLLMTFVPVLALLRAYGNGRVFAPFGVTVFDGTQGKTEWMVAAGNALHGELAWVLLALILGHVLMALGHRWLGQDDVLPRMAGSAEARAASHH